MYMNNIPSPLLFWLRLWLPIVFRFFEHKGCTHLVNKYICNDDPNMLFRQSWQLECGFAAWHPKNVMLSSIPKFCIKSRIFSGSICCSCSRSAGAKENAGGKVAVNDLFFDFSIRHCRVSVEALSTQSHSLSTQWCFVERTVWVHRFACDLFVAKAQGSRTAIDLDEVRFTVQSLFQWNA